MHFDGKWGKGVAKGRPKKNPVPFHCAGHSEKPLKAKIIFSKGFNDF